MSDLADKLQLQRETTRPEFPAADFYDCRERETLGFETPGEAVTDAIEIWADKDSDMAKLIRKYSPIRVVCFDRATLSASWKRSMASRLLEIAAEGFSGTRMETRTD